MSYQTILGLIAICIGLVSYVPYFIGIFRGNTKPHAFSWLIWTILTGTGFMAQLVGGAGAGAWIMGVISLISAIIFVLALIKGEKSFPVFDWGMLCGAVLGIIAWLITKNPLGAIIIVTVVDSIGFAPSYRKGWVKPFEECATMFAVNGLAFFVALFAIETYSLVTWLYPAALVILNEGLAIFLVIRRKKIQNKKMNYSII